MTWIKQHWIALVLVIAIPASFFVTQADSNSADQKQTDAAIKGCISASARTAYNAELGRLLQERVGARGNAGDAESAARYGGVGAALVGEIAAAEGESDGIANVTFTKLPNGEYRVALTDHAKRLQVAGCKARYER